MAKKKKEVIQDTEIIAEPERNIDISPEPVSEPEPVKNAEPEPIKTVKVQIEYHSKSVHTGIIEISEPDAKTLYELMAKRETRAAAEHINRVKSIPGEKTITECKVFNIL